VKSVSRLPVDDVLAVLEAVGHGMDLKMCGELAHYHVGGAYLNLVRIGWVDTMHAQPPQPALIT
jgi:hypothetical protein